MLNSAVCERWNDEAQNLDARQRWLKLERTAAGLYHEWADQHFPGKLLMWAEASPEIREQFHAMAEHQLEPAATH